MGEVAFDSFWTFWSGARPRLEAAMQGVDAAIFEEVSRAVARIHEKLEWEIGPGVRSSKLAFCLSAAGHWERRVLTERWLRSAPGDDTTWEFHAARPPKLPLQIEIGGHLVDPNSTVVAYRVDVSRERIDVRIHHPTFTHMDAKTRDSVAFILLDGMLGEDGVERWIGGVDVEAASPVPSTTATELKETARSLAENATGERFAVLEGRGSDGMPVLVLVNRALKRIDHVLKDVHLLVEVPIAGPNARGFPGAEENRALDAIEDEIVSLLRGRAAYCGRLTHAGRREFHFFATDDVRPDVDAWIARAGRTVRARYAPDPLWEAQRVLGGR